MGDPGDDLDLVELLERAGCHVAAQPWHALRHTFASHFVMSGGNLLTLQRLLGHSTPTMTARYAHLAPDFLSSEVARLSFPAPTVAGVADLSEARAKRANDGARARPTKGG